jgi:hypothetical protein
VILLLGTKNPSGEASLFGPGTGSESGAKKTKRLLSVATAGVATSTPETQTDDLGLFGDSGNNPFICYSLRQYSWKFFVNRTSEFEAYAVLTGQPCH